MNHFAGVGLVVLAIGLVGCGSEESTTSEDEQIQATESEDQGYREDETLEVVELSAEPGSEDASENVSDELAEDIAEDKGVDTEALLAAIRASDDAALHDLELARANEAEDRPPSVIVMRALDKITARVMPLEVTEGEEIRFGTLAIAAKACHSRPPEETPETFAFLEIDDIKHGGERERVFTGWMLASSPALNPLEHPVYDVWVIDCKISEAAASSPSE